MTPPILARVTSSDEWVIIVAFPDAETAIVTAGGEGRLEAIPIDLLRIRPTSDFPIGYVQDWGPAPRPPR